MTENMPTWQVLFDIALTLGGALGGWILATMWKEIKDARRDHSELLDKLPETYARRDDMKDRFDTVIATLGRIEDKLDRKVDK